MHRLRTGSLVFVLFETTLIVAAVWAAAYVRLGSFMMQKIGTGNGLLRTLLMAGVIQASLYLRALYDPALLDRSTLVMRVAEALAGASLVLAVLYFFAPNLIVARGVFAIAAVFVLTVLIGWRLLFSGLRASGSRLRA
jgi:hypothetical protein